MANARQLAERIVVRERGSGYLCLALPGELCAAAVAAGIETGMAGLSGVRRAHVDAAGQSLTLGFDAAQLSTASVARHLFSLLERLPEEAPAVAPALGLQPALDRLKTILIPPGEAPPGSLRARVQPVLESALTEKAVTNFFNDIVAFYLIKTHWDLITKRWLQNPLAHSNAWLTVFYLVFLLVRYRKT